MSSASYEFSMPPNFLISLMTCYIACMTLSACVMVGLVILSVRIQEAREHARRYMDLEINDFSQWFPGRLNNVADSLSRDFHLSDEKQTTYLRSFFPSQIPSSFTIVPLPNEIVSWLISLLQRLPVNELFREEHMPTKHFLGHVGSSTANQSALILTSSSTGSVEKTDT